MQEIPSGGTRRKFTKFLSYMVTILYLITCLCVFTDTLSQDQVEAVGVTFDRWWRAVGVILAIYTTGEVGAKGAHAHMNRGSA